MNGVIGGVKAFRLGSIEILGHRETRARAGFQISPMDVAVIIPARHLQRALGAMVEAFPSMMALGPFEIGQKITVTPAG